MDTANSHQEWLKEMEEQSRAKQRSFIGGISEKLRRPMVTEPLVILTGDRPISGMHTNGTSKNESISLRKTL